jgi:hypothetical protein
LRTHSTTSRRSLLWLLLPLVAFYWFSDLALFTSVREASLPTTWLSTSTHGGTTTVGDDDDDYNNGGRKEAGLNGNIGAFDSAALARRMGVSFAASDESIDDDDNQSNEDADVEWQRGWRYAGEEEAAAFRHARRQERATATTAGGSEKKKKEVEAKVRRRRRRKLCTSYARHFS